MSYLKRSEQGATVIIVAISLLMLFGVVSLAIDAGFGYNERRGTLNAADNAALAAAWEDCNPTGIGPEAAALDTASANGYDDGSDTVDVDVVGLGDGQWQVAIAITTSGIFGPATPYAPDTLDIVSEAVALCDPTQFLGGNAIFAGASACNTNELALAGSNITINGAIHSNGDLQITGSSLNLSGPVTYRVSGNQGTQDTGPPRDYPIDIDISEYRPGGSRANGLYFPHTGVINNSWLVAEGHAEDLGGNSIRITQSGIYYSSFTTNNPNAAAISLQDVDVDPGVTVTFVAEGPIRLLGPVLNNLRGHDPIVPGGTVGMLFFSDHPGAPTCNPSVDAVRFSANAALTNAAGVIFAPNAAVQISSATVELDGSIIAYSVKTSGATLTVTYTTDAAFVPDYRVELIR